MTDHKALVERLREPHYLRDDDHARTPDRVLDLIQHTLRPERFHAAAAIEESDARIAELEKALKGAQARNRTALVKRGRCPSCRCEHCRAVLNQRSRDNNS